MILMDFQHERQILVIEIPAKIPRTIRFFTESSCSYFSANLICIAKFSGVAKAAYDRSR